MTSIISKPDYGAQLTNKEGHARPDLQRYLDDITQRLNTLVGNQLSLTTYTVATLPTVTDTAGLIFVSDETGGAVPAFSDGTNWRRVTDRIVVS